MFTLILVSMISTTSFLDDNEKIIPRFVVSGGEDGKNETLLVPSTIPTIHVSDFSEESAKSFIDEMDAAEDTGTDTILINIDSYGGGVYALLAKLNRVRAAQERGVKVCTSIQGKAMSAGSVLFVMGNKGCRFIGPYSTLMIHYVAGGSQGKVPDLVVDAAEAIRLNKLLFDILGTRSGHKPEYVMNIVKAMGGVDWFINPVDAVKFGFADKIGTPKTRTVVTFTNHIE